MASFNFIKRVLGSRTFKIKQTIVGFKSIVTFKVNVIKQIDRSNYMGPGFGLLIDLILIDVSSPNKHEDFIKNFFDEIFENHNNKLDGGQFASAFWELKTNIDQELLSLLEKVGMDERFLFKLNEVIYQKENMEPLNEHKMSRLGIRSVIKDIVKILKYEDQGDYILPEDINGEHYYEFPDVKSDFNIELNVNYDESINDPIIDGGYYEDEDTIGIEIIINPLNINQSMYTIIGELNDIMAHELEHLNQFISGSHELTDKSEGDSFKYYTQPHEIEAQKSGFRRLSKLKKKPYEEIVRTWFETHKSTHKLNDDEIEEVIKLLL